MKYSNLVLASFLAVGVTVTSAWAMGPGSGPAGSCQGGPGAGGNSPMQAFMNLGDTLDLTSDQETALAEFMETLQQRRGEMMRARMSSQPAADVERPAPEILRDKARMMENRVGMMRTMADALEKFYVKLTPEQQAVLSQTIASHEGG
ncbi:MAG: Spy/CpxP family protein refolding chaperone [Marinobacter sp.]|uniref:Spy/CpxP family protein refolding chaperone n=1 Tax=Marinobacter sp. TaxID=50741 RepID=UPI00396F1391